MSGRATTTDVSVMINGRRAHIRYDGGLVASFPRHPLVRIPAAAVAGCVQGLGRIGVRLAEPTVVVPGTKRGVESFIITWAASTTASEWDLATKMCMALGECIDYRHVDCTTSVCERTEVQLGDPVVAWTSRTCTVVDNISMAVLQRTKGGMSTFDIHLVPALGMGPVVRLDMLPHSMMDQWADLFPDSIIDGGPDPLSGKLIADAQRYGRDALMAAIDGASSGGEESDVGSEWAACDSSDSSDSSGSSDSGGSSEEESDAGDDDG